MIKTKTSGSLIVISGPSGAGKGTIVKELIKNSNYWVSISATTREKRTNDVEGETYYFYTKEEFEKMIENDEFLEFAKVHSGKYYGSPKKHIFDKLEEGYDVILEIDIEGAKQIKEKYPNSIFVFIVPPSMKELKRRLVNRNTETKDKILERFQTAYKEINEISKYNYVVVNDIVDEAVSKVNSIVLAEKCRVDRIIDVDLYNKEEEIHELLVEFGEE